MVRLLTSLTVCLVAAGCATVKPPKSDGVIQSEFKPYVALFVAEGKRFGKTVQVQNLSVRFKELPLNIGGQCWSHGVIEINSRLWDKFNVYQKEIVMFHELGHCLLNKDHDNDFVNTPIGIIEESIMYPYIIGGWQYSVYRDYYLEQLFTGHGTF